MTSYVRIMYRIVQGGVYKNSVYTRLDPMACWTGMHVVRIIHLTYEVLLHLPVCLCSLCSGTALYVRVLYRTVQRVYENSV